MLTVRDLAAAAERHPLRALAVIALLNLALKLPAITADSLWLDEALSLHVAQQPLSITAFALQDETPPLHYLLLSGWGGLFGLSLESARTLSVVLSSLTALVLFDLGRRHLNGETALVAVALFSVTPLQLHFATEVRCYALVGLLCAISFDVFLALLARPAWSKAVALAVVDAALLYAHYLTVFALAAQAVAACVFARRDSRGVQQYAVSQLLALALFAPMLVFVARNGVAQFPDWIQPPTAATARYVAKRVAGSSTLLVAEAILFLGVAILRRTRPAAPTVDRDALLVLVLWSALPIALAYVASLVKPMLLDRYVLYASLGLFLLVGYALAAAPVAASVRTAMALVLVGLAAHESLTQPLLRNDWRRAAAIAAPELARGAALIVAPYWQDRPLAYYLDRDAFRDYVHTHERLESAGVTFAEDVRAVDLPDRRVVLLIGQENQLGPDEAAAWLDARGFALRRTEQLNGLLLLIADPDAATLARHSP